jgi:hypothetical protein
VAQFGRVSSEWLLGPVDTYRYSRRHAWGYVGLLLLGTMVLLFRLPLPAWNTLWAEDGSIFVSRALQGNPIGSLFEPYAGYMHAVPRLASLLAVSTMPLEYVPVTLTIIACAISSTVAAMVVLLLRSRIPELFPRLVVWAGIVTLPIADAEVNGSIANSHWYLLAGLFVVLVTRHRHAAVIALSAILACLAILSDPLSAIFLPLVIVRLVATRSRRDLWIPVVYVLSLAVQLHVALGTHLNTAGDQPTAGRLLRATGYRVFLWALAGQSWSAALYAEIGSAVLVIAALLVAVPILWTTFRGRQLGGLGAASAAWAVVFFVIAVWIRWLPLYDPAVTTNAGASRYSVVPITLILIGLVAATIAWKNSRTNRVAGVAPLLILTALILAIAVPNFSDSGRSTTENWPTELSKTHTRCLLLPANQTVKVGISPAGWSLKARCRDLKM